MKTCLVETRVVTQIPKAGMIQDNGLPDQRKILAEANGQATTLLA
jgi:hypothetical protein